MLNASLDGSQIREELLQLGLISESTVEIFSNGTHDKTQVKVFRDKNSGVVFHDFYEGDEFYRLTNGGLDRFNRSPQLPVGSVRAGVRFELLSDSQRRCSSNLQFIANRAVIDFGFGEGWFLRSAKNVAKNVYGVELNNYCRQKLENEGIVCWANLPENVEVDTLTMFHTLEHTPSQIKTLRGAYDALKNSASRLNSQGVVIVEVPHAKDFLLTSLGSQDFLKYTLRSDHCILHTRDSLMSFMNHVGFKKVSIRAVQRYPISNHLGWLSKGQPGAHTGDLSSIDSIELHAAYENALSKIDATDTLVAFGFVDKKQS